LSLHQTWQQQLEMDMDHQHLAEMEVHHDLQGILTNMGTHYQDQHKVLIARELKAETNP
jgi:hypothetical protein